VSSSRRFLRQFSTVHSLRHIYSLSTKHFATRLCNSLEVHHARRITPALSLDQTFCVQILSLSILFSDYSKLGSSLSCLSQTRSNKGFLHLLQQAMVVVQGKNPAHSTLNINSARENMSRMQQDLAASHHQPNEPSTPNERSQNMIRRVLSKGRKPHVCVIGAGFAGLRCANVLLEQGIKVTIFEARERVGGRVRTSGFEGCSRFLTICFKLCQAKVGDHLVDMYVQV
jgi:hypothetical protein